jgi:hypothetical protein
VNDNVNYLADARLTVPGFAFAKTSGPLLDPDRKLFHPDRQVHIPHGSLPYG